MKVTLHDARRDDDDVLTSSQARAGAALGALVLLASLVLAYSSAHPSLLAWLGALAGAAGVSFLFPPLGPPWLSRLVVAIVFAATTWFLDPVGAVATAGRRAQLESGSPKERAQRLAQLRARGARDLSNMLLAGGDFRGLDLSATVLDGASLRATNLQRANLAGASVRDADLAAADLSGANLTGVDVSTARGWRAARCDDETVMPTGWVCREEAPHPEGDLEP